MKRIIEMSKEEVQSNFKRIDTETKQEMQNLIKIMRSQWNSYSEYEKELAIKILKS